MNTLEILQTTFTGFTVVIAIVAVILAYEVGKKQNEINAKILGLQDFAEVFLMPQQVVLEEDGKSKHIGWNLLVKNASSYPVYINKYILNETEVVVGGSVIPTHSDSWYVIPIPDGVVEFNVSVAFEDHRGKKYKTAGKGKLLGGGWSIHSVRRVELE